jgi:hypothetical protein
VLGPLTPFDGETVGSGRPRISLDGGGGRPPLLEVEGVLGFPVEPGGG